MGGGSSDMTLAFELSALKTLAKPGEAFTEARRWSEYVGVVSDEPTYVVTNFTRKRRIRQDFFSGPKGKAESLESVKNQFDTERHVFIGTTEEDQAMADEKGWEYLDVEQAAEAADWPIGEEKRDVTDNEPEQREDWP
ncbi:MAG: hypothetical protein ABEI06_08495 [Halobacteriaceae archaeon]